MLNKVKHQLVLIFNLDEHDQPGSHWVALYANLKDGQVYFFDSYGTRPEERIRTLMRRIANWYKTTNGKVSGGGSSKLHVTYNRTRHQYENSECGVYSINFIARLLKGETFDQICGKKLPDRKVNKCRNVYFGNVDIKGNEK